MRVNSNSLCDCIVSTFTAETRAANDIHCSTEKSITKQRGGYSVISLSHKPHHRVFYLLLLVIKQPLVLIVFVWVEILEPPFTPWNNVWYADHILGTFQSCFSRLSEFQAWCHRTDYKLDLTITCRLEFDGSEWALVAAKLCVNTVHKFDSLISGMASTRPPPRALHRSDLLSTKVVKYGRVALLLK